jgi:Na+/H+ antiporter NhaD/arsenite permease-like protein
VATITGNPQNMLIGSLSDIGYLDFIAHLGPVAVVGLLLDWALIYRLYLRAAGDHAPVADVLLGPNFACRRCGRNLVPVTAVLSNVVSNVPAVMLLRTLVASFPDPHSGWLVLAMASTFAGNLTITGSIANIIVVERAAAEGVPISFGEYARIGLPVTGATLLFGTAWLWMTAS